MTSAVVLGGLLAVSVLTWMGAQKETQKNSEVRTLFVSGQCFDSHKESNAEFLLGKDQLDEFFSQQNKWQFGENVLVAPSVDLSREDVLLLSMGDRPTAGYSILLSQQHIRYSKDVAELVVEWVMPSANAIAPQVVTHPCLLLSVPKSDYRRLRVIDQFGTARWELVVP